MTALFRPLLVIGGSSDVDQESMGAFQEFPQVGSKNLIMVVCGCFVIVTIVCLMFLNET